MSDKDLGAPLSQKGQTPQFSLNLSSTAPAAPHRTPAPSVLSWTPSKPSVATPSTQLWVTQPLMVASGPAFPLGSRDRAPAPAFLGRTRPRLPGFSQRGKRL